MAMAILNPQIHGSCADVRRVAAAVPRQGILAHFAAASRGLTSFDILKKLSEEVPEAVAEAYAEKPNQ